MFWLNIHSAGQYPSNTLSNFYHHNFIFDGVQFNCMEGFLQSLKFQEEKEKIPFSTMEGREAKEFGTGKKYTHLYWQGKEYNRFSNEYFDLLVRAYESLCFQSKLFQDALRLSYPRILLHSVGKWRRGKTVLTWWEFMRILTALRKKVVQGIYEK